jgi:pimeloyl-ACP methyl ester carboxylesterase
VPANGVELAYDDHGDVGASAVVLLHALGEAAEDWSDLTPRLLGIGLRVLAFDLRGHGDSSRDVDYSSRVMAADVAAALDLLGVRDAVLVGHSLGGVVAFHLAASRPDLVSLLVVEDVCPPYDRDRPLPERPEGVELPFDWEVVPAIAAESGVTDAAAWEALAAVAAPTLLVAGGPSSHVPQDRLDEVVERIPDCTRVTIDAGHHVHRAEPDSFAEVVLGWLAVRRR